MRTEGRFFELLASAVLLNRTWVFLPIKKQSQITDTGLWWRGIQNLLWGPARSRWSSCSKDLNSFMVSRGRFLKATFGVKVTGFLTFFWLVGGEVTGLCFKNLNYQPSGSNHFIYYCGQESLRRNGVAITVNKRVQNAVLGCNLKNDRMISVHFQGKPFNIIVIQVYAPTSNIEEAEVEWFYVDIQDFLELTPPKDILFIIGLECKSRKSRNIWSNMQIWSWSTKWSKSKATRENALVIANTLFQ